MSDTPTPEAPRLPIRMPWKTFDERVSSFVATVLALRGERPDDATKAEASALFGYQAQSVLSALDSPPAICPRCGSEHQGWEALCYVCAEAEKKAKAEAAIRADERAKAGVNYAGILALLPPELAEKVRAELAQKGGA